MIRVEQFADFEGVVQQRFALNLFGFYETVFESAPNQQLVSETPTSCVYCAAAKVGHVLFVLAFSFVVAALFDYFVVLLVTKMFSNALSFEANAAS